MILLQRMAVMAWAGVVLAFGGALLWVCMAAMHAWLSSERDECGLPVASSELVSLPVLATALAVLGVACSGLVVGWAPLRKRLPGLRRSGSPVPAFFAVALLATAMTPVLQVVILLGADPGCS